MVVMWDIMYWFSFVMCWAVYPFLETYAVSGYFKKRERVKESLRSNALFYGICGGLGVVGYAVYLLVYKAASVNPIPVLMSLGNAWGLLLLLLLLGFGLVEIPRKLWRSARYNVRLERCRFEIVGVRQKLLDKREELVEAVRNLKRYTERMSHRDPFWPLIEQIVSEVPGDLLSSVGHGTGKAEFFYEDIVALRYKLHTRMHEVSAMEERYNRLVQEAFDIENILRAKHMAPDERSRMFSRYFVGIRWTVQNGGRAARRWPWIVRLLQWLWFVRLREPFLMAAAVLLGVFSCVVVWCECVFFFDHPVLSIFALFFRTGRTNAAQTFAFLSSDVVMTVLLSIPLLYIMFCSYWSLFKIQLFSLYRLLPHQSDPYSLQFSAAYLTRLAAPLTLNFLHMCKFQGSSFQAVMSSMESMPFLGSTSFNYYAPLILVLLCLLEVFNVVPRLLNCLHIKRRFLYSDTTLADSRVSETVQEGKLILDAERDNWVTQAVVSPDTSPTIYESGTEVSISF